MALLVAGLLAKSICAHALVKVDSHDLGWTCSLSARAASGAFAAACGCVGAAGSNPQSFCCLRLAVFCVFIVEGAMQDVTSGPETPMKMHCTLASSHCGGHFSLLKSKVKEKRGLVVAIDGTGLNEQSSQESATAAAFSSVTAQRNKESCFRRGQEGGAR